MFVWWMEVGATRAAGGSARPACLIFATDSVRPRILQFWPRIRQFWPRIHQFWPRIRQFWPRVLMILATNFVKFAKHFGHGAIFFGHAVIMTTLWPRVLLAAVLWPAGQNPAKISILATLFFFLLPTAVPWHAGQNAGQNILAMMSRARA